MPGITDTFDDQYHRVRSVLGVRNQIDIAARLGIKQSSISDASKRRCIPDTWKMTLLRNYGVNPLWIEDGRAPTHLDLDRRPGAERPEPERCLHFLDKADTRLLAAELCRRLGAAPAAG